MLETIILFVLACAVVYATLGGVVALLLHTRGLHSLDPATVGTSVGFRLLITPGLIALWPVMATKWWRARGGQPTAGNPESPVPPSTLLRLQSISIHTLAVLVPIAFVVGLASRPRPTIEPGSVQALLGDSAPLPEIVATYAKPFSTLPVSAVLRRDGSHWQLEMILTDDLELPALALYAMESEVIEEPGKGASGVEGGVYLGAVWGPGTRRYDLPSSPGDLLRLVVFSLARGGVVDSAELRTSRGR